MICEIKGQTVRTNGRVKLENMVKICKNAARINVERYVGTFPRKHVRMYVENGAGTYLRRHVGAGMHV